MSEPTLNGGERPAPAAHPLTTEHDALCHSDGSECPDGCDAAPLQPAAHPTPWRIKRAAWNGRELPWHYVVDANGHGVPIGEATKESPTFAVLARIVAAVNAVEATGATRALLAEAVAVVEALDAMPPVKGYGDVVPANGPAWDKARAFLAKVKE
jgi:hypothetical protein